MIPLNAAVDVEFVQIPAGTFRRGSPPEDDLADEDERPPHEVTLAKPIWISATEVTVEQFAAFVQATEYQSDAEKMIASLPKLSQALAGLTGNAVTTWREPGFGQEPTHPVVNVSWNDAVQFCQWLSSQQHRNFRLPSEAEWEYACRAGSLTRFHFGDDPQQLSLHDHAAPLEPGSPQVFTRPVRDFPANKFGLFGLHGNVAEWCHDWYGAEQYASASEPNPAGPETGEFRVRRGGAYNLPPEDCRSADRNGGRPEGMHPFVGFRIVDGGPTSIAGQWKIVAGGSFGWSSPVVFHEDGTSSLGFGFWHFQWNGCDRFEVTDQNGAKPAAFGASDSAYTWDAKLTGDRLELFQQGKLKITLERIQ